MTSSDPNGRVSVARYDAASRQIQTRWTRGAWPAAQVQETDVPAGCVRSSADDAPLPAGRITCTRTVAYDGVDNVIAIQDGNGQTTTFAFDAVRRETKRLVPRGSGPNDLLRTDTLYDLDGHVVAVCSPRHFAEAAATSCDSASKPHARHRAYDTAGRLGTETRYRDAATPLVTTSVWDADGNNISVTNPNQATTTRAFDLLDRKIAETVPRDSTGGHTTVWAYDPAGNLTAVTRPGGVDSGTGADGDLIVDGITAAGTTDGQAHPVSNPYLVPAGKNYRSVTIRNSGWISVGASPAGGGTIDLRATGTITVCSNCGVTTTGKGPAGGAGGSAGTGGGPGGPGSSGGGGGGAGHSTPGAAASGTGGGTVGGAYGRADLTETTTTLLLGSGGGGGGTTTLGTPGAGGAGGGSIRLSAATIDLQANALVTSAGTAGGNGSGVLTAAGGGGGGSGGSVWLNAPTIRLGAGANSISVTGGNGGTSSSGKNGGAGAAGRVRVDADLVTGLDPLPASWTRRRVGRVTAYRYDTANRLVEQVVGADDPDTSRAGLVDANGGINIRTAMAYDADGNVVARWDPRAFAATTSLAGADPRFMLRTDYDADGRAVTQWSPRHDLTPAAAAADVLTSGSAQGRQCPGGAPGYPSGVGVCVSRLGYDPAGNATKLTLPTAVGETNGPNRYLAYTYTDDNLAAAVDAPSPKADGQRVAASTNLYDAEGQPVKVTDALGLATATVYTPDRLVARVVEQPHGSLSHTTNIAYDAAGNRTTIIDAKNQRATWTYTADGLVEEAVDTGGNKTSYRYDPAGNPLAVHSPSANACAANANNQCVDDGNPDTTDRGTPTVNTYSADNLLLTATTPVAVNGSSRRRVSYSYDPGARKTAQQTATVNAAGQVTADGGTQRFEYQPTDRLLRETGRDGATITTRHDPAGNPLEVTDSSGSTLTATYYLDGLLRTTSDGARPNLFSYDGAGTRTYRADATSTSPSASRYTTTISINDAGLPLTGGSSLATGGGTWRWEYDLAGRPTVEQAPNNQTLTKTWNDDGTLARQQLTAATGTLADWTYPAYDELYRQKTQIHSAPSALPTGSAVTGAFTYGYDPAGRLVSFNDGSSTKTATWDADGNRLSYGTGRYTYNADDSIATSDTDGPGGATPKSHVYAAFGGTSNDGDNCLTYDGFDRLTKIAPYTGTCSATATVTYRYDGRDRQRSRTAGSTTTDYHFDGWAQDIVVETAGTTDTAYVATPDGSKKAAASQGTPARIDYLTDDGTGNLTTATSVTATLACTARFDPFGTALAGNRAPAPPENPCSSGSTVNNHFYRGGRIDKNTGNYQLGSRTYDPKKAAFLTPDTYRTSSPDTNLSIGTDPLTRNTYSYVNGDPINSVDPDGHFVRALRRWLDRQRRATGRTSTSTGATTTTTVTSPDRSSPMAFPGAPHPPGTACDPGLVESTMVPATRYPSTWNAKTCMEPGSSPTLFDMVKIAAQMVISTITDPLKCGQGLVHGDARFECVTALPIGKAGKLAKLGKADDLAQLSRTERAIGSAPRATPSLGPGAAHVDDIASARRPWEITPEGTARVVRHEGFGSFHQSRSDGLWWVKDQAGHGGSAWKVYEETATGLRWRADADIHGDFITGKHKSAVGEFIPWKELAGR